MEKYVITSYQKGFEKNQAQIGIEVEKSWAWPIQTPTELLVKSYSRPDFDPETRLYCFLNDKMVGYVTAKLLDSENDSLRASMVFPKVLASNEDAEVLLFEEIIKVLRDKGVKIVETSVNSMWNKNIELAKQRGFSEIKGQELDSKMYFNYEISDNNNFQENISQIRDFNEETDLLLCAEKRQLFLQSVDIQSSLDSIQKGLASFKKFDMFFADLVAFNDGVLLAHCSAVHNRINPDICGIAYFYAKDKQMLHQILTKLIDICKKREVSNLLIDLMGHNRVYEYFCVKMGFKKVATWAGMEKEL